MADIDAQRLAQYRRDGFILVEGLLDDVTRRRMKQVLAELIEGARAVATHDDVYDLEPTHSAAQPRVRRIKKPHLVASGVRRVHALAAPARRAERAARAQRRAAARLEAQPEGARDRLAGGVAPGLGLLSAHQRRPARRRRAARRRHRRRTGRCWCCRAATAARPSTTMAPTAASAAPWSRRATGSTSRRAQALIAPAGSCSFHHVRAVHGSAQNTLGAVAQPAALRIRRRRCLPAARHSRLGRVQRPAAGRQPTVVPRTVDCPIRMPLPPAANQGSIYENQTALQRRYFEPAPVAVPRQST